MVTLKLSSSRLAEGWRLMLLLFVLAAILRLPTLFCGFYNPDETYYATIGQRILEGKLLYAEIIDHKPPLIYFLYAFFAFIGGGKAIIVAHAMMIAVVAATGRAMAGVCRALGGTALHGLLGGLLLVACSSFGKPNDVAAANAELLFNLPLTLQILFLIKSLDAPDNRKKFLYIGISGVCAAAAILIKQHAASAPAAALVYLQYRCIKSPPLFSVMVSYLISLLLPLLAVALWLNNLGLMQEAWYWMVAVNSLYVQGHEQGMILFFRFIKQTVYMLLLEQACLWFPIALWVVVRKKGEKLLKEHSFLIVLWLFASFAAIFPGGRFFGHYYLQILPPVCVIGTAAILALASALSNKFFYTALPSSRDPQRTPKHASGLVRRALCLKEFLEQCYRELIGRHTSHQIAWRRILKIIWALMVGIPLVYSWIWALPVKDFRKELETEEFAKVINYLKENTEPEDKIEVWGKFNGIPFLAGRENGARFLSKHFLAGNFRGQELVPMPDSHWEKYMHDLEKNRPEWFVDISSTNMPNAPISRFSRLASYVAENYKLEAEIDGYKIYRRKAPE